MRFPRITAPALVATAAIALVLTTSTAYAINEWSGANIKDGTLTGADIKANSVPGKDIKDSTVTTLDIKNNSLKTNDIADNTLTSLDILDETLTEGDLANNSVGFAEIQTDAVQASEIQDNSIDFGEIVDFGLTNEDIGVLEAQVNANGTLAASDHAGTTSSSIGTGTYEVDFARSVSNCTPIVTQGEAGVGGAGGAIVGATDRSGNVEAFFVTTRDAAGALVNTAFHIVVVC